MAEDARRVELGTIWVLLEKFEHSEPGTDAIDDLAVHDLSVVIAREKGCDERIIIRLLHLDEKQSIGWEYESEMLSDDEFTREPGFVLMNDDLLWAQMRD